MSIATILPLIETLPHSEKFHLMHVLLNYLANEEGVSLQAPQTNQGQKMAAILQRMADRNALSQITDPVAWQKEIRNSLLAKNAKNSSLKALLFSWDSLEEDFPEIEDYLPEKEDIF